MQSRPARRPRARLSSLADVEVVRGDVAGRRAHQRQVLVDLVECGAARGAIGAQHPQLRAARQRTLVSGARASGAPRSRPR